ncbi:MAG TPA: cell division protein ZapA [Acidobacteriota bacterium]|nr:cell division protein ZapA [Acidobacteriota bacterium]
MDTAPKTVHVKIFGEDYPLRSKGEADVAYMTRVADHVDRSMREIAERSPNLSATKVAILAALNITDELLAERRDVERKLTDVHSRARGILAWLDERLEVYETAQT